MKPGTSKPSLTWMLAIGGGLIAGASMSLFEQGMAKALVPGLLIVLFAFASTFLSRTRKRVAVLAWLAGGAAAALAATVGRYVELTRATEEMLGSSASAAELAAVTEAAVGEAKLSLMAVVLTVVAFLVALVPVMIGALARPKPATPPFAATA